MVVSPDSKSTEGRTRSRREAPRRQREAISGTSGAQTPVRVRGLTPAELEEAQILARTKVALNKRLKRETVDWVVELAEGGDPWAEGIAASASHR